MRIGLVASPFIPVPPLRYGGTELFVANLAKGLKQLGVEPIIYTNGASTADAEIRWKYAEPEWPLSSESAGLTKELDHLSWSLMDAGSDCDLVHVNSSPAVTYSRFLPVPMCCTIHHPYNADLNRLYEEYSDTHYAAISHDQASWLESIGPEVIHHGLDMDLYRFREEKQPYLSFLGRICPIKGTHVAIEIAKRAGIPLKIAGEIQPIYQGYFDSKIRPHLDGRNVEFVGEADAALKNELLGNSMGMLFPIQWAEPFGMVMVEAMACGTPVIAFAGGAVAEVVSNGISGRICENIEEAVHTVTHERFRPRQVRNWAEEKFSVERMADDYLRYYNDILEGPTLLPSKMPRSEAA